MRAISQSKGKRKKKKKRRSGKDEEEEEEGEEEEEEEAKPRKSKKKRVGKKAEVEEVNGDPLIASEEVDSVAPVKNPLGDPHDQRSSPPLTVRGGQSPASHKCHDPFPLHFFLYRG